MDMAFEKNMAFGDKFRVFVKYENYWIYLFCNFGQDPIASKDMEIDTFPHYFSDLSIDEFSRKKMDATAEELSEEKALAYSCLT